MARQPTPQGISALLRKAGFTRSERRPSKIRGLREYSEGYLVGSYGKGAVVMHRPGFARGVAAQVREHKKLNAYTEAIESAGWRVQRDQVGFSTSLIVTAREA